MQICSKTILAYVTNRLQKGTYGRGFTTAIDIYLNVEASKTGIARYGRTDWTNSNSWGQAPVIWAHFADSQIKITLNSCPVSCAALAVATGCPVRHEAGS